MRSTTLIVVLSCLFLSMGTIKQQTVQYFVQLKIHTVTAEEEAQEIDRKMEKKSEILTSNTDHITSTIFCLLEPGADISEDDITGWLGRMGYNTSCFHKGVQGVDAVLSPHELKNCKEKKEE